MTCFGLGKFGRKGKVRFIVNVHVAHGDYFVCVAKNVPVREPAIYQEHSIKQAIRDQHPKLWQKHLLGKSWTVTIEKWITD